jgi:hypothetical protein
MKTSNVKCNGHKAKNVSYIDAFHSGRQEDETNKRRLISSRVDGNIIGQQNSAGIESGAKAGRSLIRKVLVTSMDSRVMKMEST